MVVAESLSNEGSQCAWINVRFAETTFHVASVVQLQKAEVPLLCGPLAYDADRLIWKHR